MVKVTSNKSNGHSESWKSNYFSINRTSKGPFGYVINSFQAPVSKISKVKLHFVLFQI